MNIIITGASRGLGKAIAEKFAANGFDLFLCARNVELLEELATTIRNQYPKVKVHYKSCDVSLKDEVLAFGAWILNHTTSVDVLINNAGAFISGNVHDEPDGTLEQLMNTNVYSAYYLTRALLPEMIKHKSGHIFNICSIASLKAYKNGGSYSITKYALSGFSANLRDELRHDNIKVTSVFPGAVNTDSWSASGIDPDRIMKSEDIADMVFASSRLSPQACVEEIVIRPQLGDL
ncbi:MAG: SDR family oxidoreductase [Flavitalea sp.]